MSPWYTRQDRDRDHDSVRVRAFALEALEQLKASFAVVSESALVLGDETSIIVRSVRQEILKAVARLQRLASLVEPTLSATAIASVCRAAGPIGVLKRVSPAESTIAPKRGHALIEGIKPAIRSAPSVAVLSTPRRSRGCVSA